MNVLQTIHMLPRHYLIVFLCIVCNVVALQNLPAGSTIKAFFWTQEKDGGVKNGCYGNVKMDSLSSGESNERYFSTFWLPTYQWWHTMFPKTYLTTIMSISGRQPTAVSRASGHFSAIPWFEGFERTDSSGNSMRFPFPLLPQASVYGRYDYFTVDVDDTLDLEFYGAGDSIMVGTFIHKKPNALGSVNIIARNAIIVELTKVNPLRIKSVRCNGFFEPLISHYLQYDLTKLKKNVAWYGVDLIDTSSKAPVIRVGAITIEGTSPYVAGSTHKISWPPGDVSEVDSFLIYISFDSAKTWSVTGKILKDSSFIWTVPNHESDNAFIKITAFGHNGERISSQSNRFSIIIPAGFRLDVQSYATSSIIASWNPSAITTPGKRAVCIAYCNGSVVNKVTAGGIDTIMYDLQTSRDTITGLDRSGMWYFTAFILDSTGAFILAGPNAIDSALAEDLTAPINSFILAGIAVDSTRIRLSWRVNGAVDTDIDTVGIWMNEYRYPTAAHDTGSRTAAIVTAADSVDTIVKLKPAKTYYFALFVADSSGNWSGSTAQSMVQVRTPVGPGSIDSANAIQILGSDTQSVFSDTIKLWSNDLKSAYVDTIDAWTAPAAAGCINVGPSFTFRYGMLPAGSTVSIKVKTGDVPAGYALTDLRVYRYNIYTGNWRIEEGAITFDTLAGTVTFTSKEARLPVILMIDTVQPDINVTRKDTAAYSANQPITDTFTVVDNIENVTIKLLASPGNLGYSDISLYAVAGSRQNEYITTIPAFVADPCSGVRGLFTVSDGRNRDTINLSRKIIRTGMNCDDAVAGEMAWTPLFVTAEPEKKLLSSILTSIGNPWVYNTENERIIQWLPLSSNKTSEDKWVEYAKATDSLFTFTLGKLFWMKSGTSAAIPYGKAIVPALIDTFGIVLKKGQWTDFSMPYQFDIYSGDILAATEGKSKSSTDSIELYQWLKSKKTYTTDPVYLPGIGDLENPNNIITGGSAYTAFNAAGKDIILRIPPVCAALSKVGITAGGIAKKAGNTAWCVKIGMIDRDGVTLPPMYCASTPADGVGRFYALPPGFSVVSAGIFNATTGRRYGHAANGDLKGGGTTYRVVYENRATGPATINSRIEYTSGLPTDVSARLYRNDDSHTPIPTDSNTITLSSNQKVTGYLVIGTEAYINDMVKQLSSILAFTPFTCNGGLRIRYTLPAGVSTLSFVIFDLKGRRVVRKVKTDGLNAGAGSLWWEGLISAGYYIVQLQADFEQEGKTLVMNKRWLYVR
ncbi:MAG: hypothetical protein JW913_19195 [Chitinispirillaceae bacterium]|nr:hypothetical protein [Chitinispirillaceae bacterium]